MGLTARWAGLFSSRGARRATIALVVLHLAGCVADGATEQYWLMSLFCLIGDSTLTDWLVHAAWLLLALSWAIGLIAIRRPSARPFYWALLLAIPIAHMVQQSLLAGGLLRCDGP